MYIPSPVIHMTHHNDMMHLMHLDMHVLNLLLLEFYLEEETRGL
jgi:hypothetical protein